MSPGCQKHQTRWKRVVIEPTLLKDLSLLPLKKLYRRCHYFVELHRRNILPNTYAWTRLAAWKNTWPAWATTNKGMHLVSDHSSKCLVGGYVYWMPRLSMQPPNSDKFFFEDSQPLTIAFIPPDDPQCENWRAPVWQFKAMPCMGLKCLECD